MLISEQRASKEERKDRIRKRYEGIASDRIEVIPAKSMQGPFDTDERIRVAVYARVSTGDPNQTT